MNNIDKSLFDRVNKENISSEIITRPSVSYWKDAMNRLMKNKVAIFCISFLILIVLLSVFVPIFSPFSHSEQHITHTYATAFTKCSDQGHLHILGTDELGRDQFTRLFRGARISMLIAFSAVAINFLIGVIYGGISGYMGGKADNLMMRIIEIINGIPYLMVVILLMTIMGSGVFSIIVAYAAVGWTTMARLVRGQVIALKEQEFVIAAKAMGASPSRIIKKYLIPNTLSVVIVNITLAIPNAIFTEAFLSFIGLGVSTPEASWGTLSNDGIRIFQQYPMQLFAPALCISLTMLAFNLLGDALRDSLDPKLRR
ncbi:MAG: ABC transporter permease [Oscillospiraceae bacterium]